MTRVEQLAKLLQHVRERRPLVHNITNLVVTNVTANATLAIGASPVMSHAIEEVADMVQAAGALVLNIGTLDPDLVEAMVVAGKKANELGIPVVLDPVGAGATPLRTQAVRRIIDEVEVAILRGNASEVAIVGGHGGAIKGVDAVQSDHDMAELARTTARELGCVVAVTGEIDYVSDGEVTNSIGNGHPLMSFVTGTGCMATSVTGAWAAVTDDMLLAATGALACFGLAGERAAERAEGPGSFQAALFDELYGLTAGDLKSGARVTFGQPQGERS